MATAIEPRRLARGRHARRAARLGDALPDPRRPAGPGGRGGGRGPAAGAAAPSRRCRRCGAGSAADPRPVRRPDDARRLGGADRRLAAGGRPGRQRLGPAATSSDRTSRCSPTDESSVVVAVSRTTLALLGFGDAGELVGRRVIAIIPPRFRQAHIAGTTLHVVNGRAPLLGVPVTVPVLLADGSERTVAPAYRPAAPVRGSQGLHRRVLPERGRGHRHGLSTRVGLVGRCQALFALPMRPS